MGSDPYDDIGVKSRDHMLHKTLKDILLVPEKCTDKNSMFKLILEREPALNKVLLKNNKLSLLWITVLGCYQDSAELLVQSGSDVNEVYEYVNQYRHVKKLTVLHKLLKMYPSSWNERFIGLVVDHGADLEARDDANNTGLHLAVSYDRVEVVKMLLEKGADVNAVGCGEYQAIHMAARKKTIELVNLLLDHGANVNAVTHINHTPLHIAAESSNNPEMLLTLLKRGANIDAEYSHGFTALCVIVADHFHRFNRNILEKVKILLFFDAYIITYSDRLLDLIRKRRHLMDNQGVRLIFRTLALKKQACMQPSIESCEEHLNLWLHSKLWTYYQDSNEELNRITATEFIKNCTFFDILTKCRCQIVAHMRNQDFEKKFRQFDLSVFPIYTEDILEAFERVEQYYQSILDQENLIDEAVYNALPHMVVRKVTSYALSCELCEIRKTVQASRGVSR